MKKEADRCTQTEGRSKNSFKWTSKTKFEHWSHCYKHRFHATFRCPQIRSGLKVLAEHIIIQKLKATLGKTLFSFYSTPKSLHLANTVFFILHPESLSALVVDIDWISNFHTTPTNNWKDYHPLCQNLQILNGFKDLDSIQCTLYLEPIH